MEHARSADAFGRVGILCVACMAAVWLSGSVKAQDATDLANQRRAMEQLGHRLKVLEDSVPQEYSAHRKALSKSRADRNALREITLPPHPTKEQIRLYVQSINTIALAEGDYVPDDPYEDMLRRIGAKNLGILLEFLDSIEGGLRWYACKVCNELAEEAHKEPILRQLAKHPSLIEAVQRNGWEADAKPIIMKPLRNNEPSINVEWIRVIAAFKDPETLPDLRRYLRAGDRPYFTHEAIKDFAGDLTGDVAAAWQRERAEQAKGRYYGVNTAALAMAYGHRDAFEEVMQSLNPAVNSDGEKSVVARIRACVQATGSDAEILRWLMEHKRELVFDKETRKWRVPKKKP